MTPERAKQLAEDNGCTFFQLPGDPDTWVIERNRNNFGYIVRAALRDCTEAHFVAYYIPDKRD